MLEGFSIKDEKAGFFSPPFFSKNAIVAMRDIQTSAQDPRSNLGKYPQDFALYYICLFNEDNGDLEQATPHLVIKLTDLLTKGPANVNTSETP